MTVKDRRPEELRAEVGNHLDDARKELMSAAKIADRLSMRGCHRHTLMAVAHVDDALALLTEMGQ